MTKPVWPMLDRLVVFFLCRITSAVIFSWILKSFRSFSIAMGSPHPTITLATAAAGRACRFNWMICTGFPSIVVLVDDSKPQSLRFYSRTLNPPISDEELVEITERMVRYWNQDSKTPHKIASAHNAEWVFSDKFLPPRWLFWTDETSSKMGIFHTESPLFFGCPYGDMRSIDLSFLEQTPVSMGERVRLKCESMDWFQQFLKSHVK